MRLGMLLAAGLAWCSPMALGMAQADSLEQILKDDRPAFDAAVRDYLLTNPEVLLEAMEILQNRETQAAASREKDVLSSNKDAIYQNPNDWVGGNITGDVTVVEFMDYRCGYCHKAFEEVEELVSTDGNIRFVLKEFPVLGEQSVLAAKVAIAVKMLHGDDSYKQAHDALFKLRGTMNADTLGRMLSDINLNADDVLAKAQTPEVQAVIDENYRLAELMEINGTPTFIIDDSFVRGYMPLADMRQVVQDKRDEG